jgi:putative ABC transport system substrate-binding protein
MVAHRAPVISAAARNQVRPTTDLRLPETAVCFPATSPGRQLASRRSYVDHNLRGAKPVELPVQLPTKFETIVNLETAKALGLAIRRRPRDRIAGRCLLRVLAV